MDIPLILDMLVPAAIYGGAFENHTRQEYNALSWEDPRPKPSWTAICNAWVDVLKNKKHKDISLWWASALKGSVPTSLGFNMQFDQKDVWAVRNVIEFAEANGENTIYLTDADDVSHEGITLEQAKGVLMEMGIAHLQAHRRKQALRAIVNNASTVQQLQDITWETDIGGE